MRHFFLSSYLFFSVLHFSVILIIFLNTALGFSQEGQKSSFAVFPCSHSFEHRVHCWVGFLLKQTVVGEKFMNALNILSLHELIMKCVMI